MKFTFTVTSEWCVLKVVGSNYLLFPIEGCRGNHFPCKNSSLFPSPILFEFCDACEAWAQNSKSPAEKREENDVILLPAKEESIFRGDVPKYFDAEK